jgi:protein-S-isoprenylcysteine O-methyltransferase Ste14
MSVLDALTVALFALWCLSEVAIQVITVVNRRGGPATVEDRFSYLATWLAVMVTVFLALATWRPRGPAAGLGHAVALGPVLGWLGCGCLVLGIAVRLAAVATLRRQFTTVVVIGAQHRLVDSGPYRRVPHPAYLGLLLSMLGLGLCSGHWVSLAVAVGLPLAAILYRIRIEERALLRDFGRAYAAYASRTKQLVPGIY